VEQKIEIVNRTIQPRLESIADWNVPESEKVKLKTFLEQLGLGRINKGRKISESRQCKYLDVLRAPLEFFAKPAAEVTLQDIEAFELALSRGEVHTRLGKEYSNATKVDIRRALKIYLRWSLGRQVANELVDWLDTRNVRKTPDFLKEVEVERLYKSCKSARERFLIAMLFDSGARATEFHNIRYGDIQFPREANGYVKITLKEEYSKTKGRTISLFWKYSLEAVQDYMQERQ
jgi:integrase